MARYKMDDGTIADTTNAQRSWVEDTNFDGNNHISVNTGGQWSHEALYQSRKGRYYIVSWSDWDGSIPSAEYVSDEKAAAWLIRNNADLPAELEAHEDSIVE